MVYPEGVPRLSFPPTQRSIEVPAGTRLIDAIRRAGLPIARACGDDLICGKCGVRVLSGSVIEPRRAELEALRRNRVPEGLRLACVIRVRDDLELTADYWGEMEP